MAYGTKKDFLEQGTMPLHLNLTTISQDCSICKNPLLVNEPKAAVPSNFHSAVCIKICGHAHGEECLKHWLSINNTCPTCKRVLFPSSVSADANITQDDCKAVLSSLGQIFGKGPVMEALIRIVPRQGNLLQAEEIRRMEEEIRRMEEEMRKMKEEIRQMEEEEGDDEEGDDWAEYHWFNQASGDEDNGDEEADEDGATFSMS
ncbi:hypothetical protein K504DRAFT_532445 [Pleomassaria siparia CBS 279.74]|uniref:RING-type domain-containing protein n=1 Tax=Pleomassaria siparia CBS 279.74 TaxID=1314801 RepID=A0A6G1KHB0_9PLEO|nr:hypothetical protein K504DRAFT_532445 [Pleomassaria siparia CBS 279.74]